MNVAVVGIALIVGLFVAMVALLEIGRRLGKRRPPPGDEAAGTGRAAVENAVFALMGLLLAFSFSGALSRWDTRRQHIVQEVNAIGTAYLRVGLLPEAARPAVQQQMRDYVDARLAVYDDILDREATKRDQEKVTAMQGEIWRKCSAELRSAETPQATMLLVPALNEMFDMATQRDFTASAHPPLIVFLMLAAAVLTSSLLAGFDMAGSRRTSKLHVIGYAAMLALTVYATLDIEFPRMGFVRIDSADQAFVDLRASMK